MELKLAFVALTLVSILLLLTIGFRAINQTFSDKSKAKKKKMNLLVGLLLWQIYVVAVSQSGVLSNLEFPPRFFLFLILPLFVFTGIYLYKNQNNAWIQNIPKHWLIFYQSFRILIETLFVFSVAQGILNKEVTIEGYNFDIIFAFTAPIIGYLAYKNISSKKVLIVWNYLGLAVIASIIFLFLSSIFNPQLFGSEVVLLPKAATQYPYVLVAGFLMPSAVFVHVLSIVQLIKSSN